MNQLRSRVLGLSRRFVFLRNSLAKMVLVPFYSVGYLLLSGEASNRGWII